MTKASGPRCRGAGALAACAVAVGSCAGAVAGCRGEGPKDDPARHAGETAVPAAVAASAPPATSAPATSSSLPAERSSAAPASAAGPTADSGDAGPRDAGSGEAFARASRLACPLVRSAAPPVRSGPLALAFVRQDAPPRIVWNVAGAPAVEAPTLLDPPGKRAGGVGPGAAGAAPCGAKGGPPCGSLDPVAASGGAQGGEAAQGPSCAYAGGFSYCMDPEGAVRRSRPSEQPHEAGGPLPAPIAHGRRGTRIAAASAGGRTVLAFLAQRKTTEGVVTQAFAVLDELPAVGLSEDGSGATHVALAARRDHVLAMYVDTRTALTPIHVRALRLGERLEPGRDAVVLVAGGSDVWTSAALGTDAAGTAYALAPTTSEDGRFGLATVTIEGDPKDDLPARWSLYPAAIRPALVAATQGRSPVWVARTRPAGAERDARAVLELGHVDDTGQFALDCEVAEAASFSELSVGAGDDGTVWLAYRSTEGARVEQRRPARR